MSWLGSAVQFILGCQFQQQLVHLSKDSYDKDRTALFTHISGASFGVGRTAAFCLPISLYTQHLCVISLGFLQKYDDLKVSVFLS